VIEAAALAGLGAVADEHQELVGMVPGRFDLEERVAADQHTAADQQLGEDRGWVGLSVRRDPGHDLAGQAVIGGLPGCHGPVGRWRRQRERPRPAVPGRLVEQRDQLAGHSAVISASAARAELSSQIDLLAA
jgi:hypothetical protein